MTAGEAPGLQLPIRTARLVLRALSVDDLEQHARLAGDPGVVRYLYEEAMDLEGARAHLERRLPARLPAQGEWLNLAVEFDGEFVGEVGVSVASTEHRQCEIGYVFAPDAGGRGFATEAAAAMVDLAFNTLGAHRVSGRLDARNTASARLLERLGMRREAHLRENEFVKGEWTDELVYAITADEWRARESTAR